MIGTFLVLSTLTRAQAKDIQDAAVPYVMIQTEERNVKVLSNMVVDLSKYVGFDPAEVGIHEGVYYPVLETLLNEYSDEEELKAAIARDASDLVPKHITKEDIIASINYNIHLEYGIEQRMISITLVTDVSVQSENFRRIP